MPENTAPAQPEPADLEAFDFDGFIAGIVRPSRVVPVAKDRALGAQIVDTERRIAELEAEEADRRADGRGSKRRAATAESPEMDEARAHLADLTEQARGQFFYVRIEDLTRKIRKQAIADGTDGGKLDQDAYNMSALSMIATVHDTDPRVDEGSRGRVLTVEQWDQLSEAIGVRQYESLIDAAGDVTQVGVSPDFSQPASHSPETDTSDKS